MKRLIIVSFICLGMFSHSTVYAQVGNTAAGTSGTDFDGASLGRGSAFTVGGHLRLKEKDNSIVGLSIESKKKKYLSYSYERANIDYDIQGYVRYNIYRDEVEFIKDNNIYYLAKDVGKRVSFINRKATYKVFELEGKAGFFKVQVSGNHSLLVKHRVRYVEARGAQSGYDRPRPPKFIRMKDEVYLALNNRKLFKVTGTNKSEFVQAFGNHSKHMTDFMKQNKLHHKRLEDLEKIIAYFNSL